MLLTCCICNKSFSHTTAGRPPKTCPGACRRKRRKALWIENSKRTAARQKQKRHAEKRICANCGKVFSLTEGGYRYCSKECGAKTCRKNGSAKRRARENRVDYESPVYKSELVTRDGPNCCHCGLIFDDEFPAEVDHIIPLSRGGVHAGYNCQLLCKGCNSEKGAGIPLVDLRKAQTLWPQNPTITERDPRRAILSRKIRPYSGYRGVSEHRDKFRCRLVFEGKVFRKGGFEAAEDAAEYYDFLCGLLGLSPEFMNGV